MRRMPDPVKHAHLHARIHPLYECAHPLPIAMLILCPLHNKHGHAPRAPLPFCRRILRTLDAVNARCSGLTDESAHPLQLYCNGCVSIAALDYITLLILLYGGGRGLTSLTYPTSVPVALI